MKRSIPAYTDVQCPLAAPADHSPTTRFGQPGGWVCGGSANRQTIGVTCAWSSRAPPGVRRQIDNYKRFKALTAQWVDLGIEHSRLKTKLAREP